MWIGKQSTLSGIPVSLYYHCAPLLSRQSEASCTILALAATDIGYVAVVPSTFPVGGPSPAEHGLLMRTT